MAGRRHEVQAGECVASVARRFGVAWKTLWDHPENARLKALRKDPEVLLAGDVLFVPEAPDAARTASAGTGAKHAFQVDLDPVWIRLQLVAGGAPRAGKQYVLELDDGTTREGVTDGDGLVAEKVPAMTRTATLRLESPDLGTEEYVLRLGHLDPVSEAAGVRQRLRNLGFHCEALGAPDEDLRGALALFQQTEGLAVTGELDAGTRNKLREVHGG